MRDPSDKIQGPIQQGFPVKSVGITSTKIICNQTLMISVHLSRKIMIQVLRQGLLALSTMIYMSDFAHGPISKCPKFSQGTITQLRAKSASVSLLSKYLFPFLLKNSLEVDTRNYRQQMDQFLH